MKVLTTHKPGGAWSYITDGWINAFRAVGIQCERWDGKQTTWDAFNPDLMIGCSGHRQPIPAKRRAKVAIHVNPYGSVSIKGIDESQDAINWTKAQKPDAVFGYGHALDIPFWDKWPKELCPWVPMATAGDATVFYSRQGLTNAPVPRDIPIGYIGGRWDYKAKNLDRYLFPLFSNKALGCKVHGWGGWQPGISTGPIQDDHVAGFFSRCRVCPCVVEPHTTQWGIDLPERVFKVILCGALAIHDPVNGLSRFSKNIVMANGPMEFIELCVKWSRPEMESQRRDLAEKQRRDILDGHTYFHRLAGLLRTVGFAGEADKMLEHAKSIV